MGDTKLRNCKGARKKVANIGNYSRLMILNGELPPLPKDESEAKFFKSRGIAILDDDFEREIFSIFIKVIKGNENGFLSLNYELIKEYAELKEFEYLELCEILSVVLASANKALGEKMKARE